MVTACNLAGKMQNLKIFQMFTTQILHQKNASPFVYVTFRTTQVFEKRHHLCCPEKRHQCLTIFSKSIAFVRSDLRTLDDFIIIMLPTVQLSGFDLVFWCEQFGGWLQMKRMHWPRVSMYACEELLPYKLTAHIMLYPYVISPLMTGLEMTFVRPIAVQVRHACQLLETLSHNPTIKCSYPHLQAPVIHSLPARDSILPEE